MSSLEESQEQLNDVKQKKQRRFSRHCICLALFFPMLILLLLLLIGAIVFTNPGLKLLVWGAEKALPSLYIDNVEGSLLPEFSLSGISYQDKSFINTKVNHLRVAFTPECLMQPALCVDDISIDGLTLVLPELPESETAEKPEPTEPSLLSVPIPISVTNITLNNIDMDILGNRIQWRSFNTGVKLHHSDLTITPLSWKKINVELAKQTASQEQTDELPKDKPAAKIILPSIYIPLNINVEKFALRDFTLHQDSPIKVKQLDFVAKAGEHDVHVKDFYLDMPQASLAMDSDVKLDGDYPLILNAILKVKETELKDHTVTLDAKGSIADLNASAQLSGGLQVNIDAELQPLDPVLPFNIKVSKGDLYWPLVGEKTITASIPNIKAKGDLDKYQFSGSLYIEGKEIPQTNIRLEGKGDTSSVNLYDLLIDTLGGQVSGNAEIDWRSLLQWKGDIDLQNIQPGIQWEAAEGNISGRIETSGSLTDKGGWNALIPVIDIKGIFRKYPLDVNGSLFAHDKDGKGEVNIDIPSLALHHGDNGIEVTGEVNKELDLNVDVDFPELSDSVPDLYGKLFGDIRLTGKVTEPKVELDIDALGLKWKEEATLKKASINGYIVPMPKINADLRLDLSKGQYKKQILEALNIKFSGKEEGHRLSVNLDSNVIDSSLVIDGALDRKKAWKGELSKAEVNTEIGPWKLDKKAALAYDIQTSEVFIQANCWSQGPTSLCLNKDLLAGKSGIIDLSVNHFEFSKLKAFLPEETKVNGEANLNVIAKWEEQKKPYVKAALHLPKGNVQQQMEQPLTIGWDDIKVGAEMENDVLNASWLIDLTDNGQLNGQVSIDDLTGKKTLKGISNIETLSLSMFEPLLGEYSQLQGMINSKVNFSGPMLRPKSVGDLVINNIVVKGDVSPVDIDNGDLQIKMNGYDGELISKITTPDGDLNINGSADWHDLNNWKAGLDVFGNELEVNVPPIVKLKVKPDMKIRIIPTLAKITGSIGIPWGRIVVNELPESAVGVSKDEVILNNDLQPIETETTLPMEVETNIAISIGNDVLLSAFGLEAGLVGRLNVTQRNKAPFITGEVNIENGTYRSFGQDLQIRKGKILFNGPADQPYVDIEAIRNPDNTKDDVIAGVKVSGPADTPRVEIFSSPSMPQANALSYLLRGQDIDSESGGNAMTTTLIGLSLAKSGKVVGEIGQAFGVQDLQLDTAGSGDDSQVTISGYIAPDLQVKYGVGIFNSLGEFTLRYRIISDLYIEAISGVDSAVDLIYQFSFD